MTSILIVKTAALGDVLRTTSILPGLHARYPAARVTWLTAPGAVDLVAHHPGVAEVRTVETGDTASVAGATAVLATSTWDLVLSFDDEEPLCRLVSAIPARRRSGAFLDADGRRTYSDDVEPWFGMGLLARDGRQAADRRKRENRRTHPEIFATMLGVEPGRPELPLAVERLDRARRRLTAAGASAPCIGLNTGAGGRWRTKAIPPERCVALVGELAARLRGAPSFVLFGGIEEAERNRAIAAGIAALPSRPKLIDTGVDNDLLDFAALLSCCDLVVTSDSLGMHVAIARRVPLVAFFAPTSAAEIDLFGLGEKVASTAPDSCSYRTDANNDSITVERLADACLRVLASRGVNRR